MESDQCGATVTPLVRDVSAISGEHGGGMNMRGTSRVKSAEDPACSESVCVRSRVSNVGQILSYNLTISFLYHWEGQVHPKTFKSFVGDVIGLKAIQSFDG
jgi:hypothetical protein